MRIAVDFDWTLISGDIEKPVLNLALIEMLNASQAEIIVYTSRGMLSQGGDPQKCKDKYHDKLTEILKPLNYTAIEYGKPYFDLLIDDKAVAPGQIQSLSGGFTENKVFRLGERVIKKFASQDECEYAYQYAVKNPSHPEIINRDNNTITMRFIDGRQPKTITDYYQVIDYIKANDLSAKDSYAYFNYISDINTRCDYNFDLFRFKLPATRMHGDLSVSNVIIDQGGAMWLIDPLKRPFTSHLIDLGKLLFTIKFYNYDPLAYQILLDRFYDSRLEWIVLYEAMRVGKYSEVYRQIAINIYESLAARENKKVRFEANHI